MKPYGSLLVSVPGPFSVRALPTRPDPNYPKPVPSWGRFLHKLVPVLRSPGLGPVSAPSPSPAPARLSWTSHRPKAGSVLGISWLCIRIESVSGLGVAFVLCPLNPSAHSKPWTGRLRPVHIPHLKSSTLTLSGLFVTKRRATAPLERIVQL